ncbi:MAG: segregation/condensation protein A [Deltaproteobacteria bacterium]|nr:segregation/condensation protein A [Deltaproteobacteria bacterium]
MSITVKLEIYEGPLDLLLHLIRKNEVDIYDIPIALITEQYLEYLQALEALNVEIAGEFLLMASTLTQIKSKLLLPQIGDTSESDEPEEDPRMAIVRPLLEHLKLRDAAEILERRDILNRDVFSRAPILAELEPSEENLIEVNLFELIEAFRQMVSQAGVHPGLRFMVETKTIQQRIMEIIRELKKEGQITFWRLCATDQTKADLVLSFLAVLELARIGCLRLFQHQATKEIAIYWIEPKSTTDSVNGDSGRLRAHLDQTGE